MDRLLPLCTRIDEGPDTAGRLKLGVVLGVLGVLGLRMCWSYWMCSVRWVYLMYLMRLTCSMCAPGAVTCR
ncbi:hypothetical protein D7231_14645 [Streptomyces klenkii]|uniref:Uncharacterized protein n=1 Tax=Streptomyces klenkii TaxID=1420899 RepID=A0A3B0BK98_9ACTN|nr:hypothetical protein D7231_14645 [Streptomyces klenkii]